jgi:MFS superfamily sulfate permease-like transporter
MKIKDFEFNLRELAGSMGDFGTLLPFAVGYIMINGIDPAGLLIMLGLTNILTGIVYRLPIPIQPMKLIGVVAIAQKWSPGLIYASGFGSGIIWLFMVFTGAIDKVARLTPKGVVRGIQVALGIMLVFKGFEMISTGWILGIIALVIVIFLRESKYAPAAIVLMILGIVIVAVKGELLPSIEFRLSLPPLTTFTPREVWDAFVLAGFAQLPLTVANAVIATAALIRDYWPEKPVPERKLALNMGIMNSVAPFLGGMPMCHGAGGLAGKYYFGGRTGGTNIIEGVIEVSLGLFLASSIANFFQVFPKSILGAMLFLIGLELAKFVKDIKKNEIAVMATTAILSLIFNMAVGFLSGLLVHYFIQRISKK